MYRSVWSVNFSCHDEYKALSNVRIRRHLRILSSSESIHPWLIRIKSKIFQTGGSLREIPIFQRWDVWSVDSKCHDESETLSHIEIRSELRILGASKSTHLWPIRKKTKNFRTNDGSSRETTSFRRYNVWSVHLSCQYESNTLSHIDQWSIRWKSACTPMQPWHFTNKSW